jgi:hypothetical protein
MAIGGHFSASRVIPRPPGAARQEHTQMRIELKSSRRFLRPATLILGFVVAVPGLDRDGRSAVHALKRDVTYRFETIDVPDATATSAFGISDRGEMVGRTGNEEAGDAWVSTNRGGLEIFDFPGAPFTEAFEITDKGVIAGWFTDTAGVSHGFVRDRDGFRQIDVPSSAWTIVLAATNREELAGFYGDPDDPDLQHGFVRDRRGHFTTFDVPGATVTQPFGMNDAGVIVGIFSEGGEERGFVREKSGEIRIVDYPGADASGPLGVNNRGRFVGFFEDAAGIHGYVWDGASEFTPFDVPGMSFTVPLEIDDRGRIVGYFADADEQIHGFIARPERER